MDADDPRRAADLVSELLPVDDASLEPIARLSLSDDDKLRLTLGLTISAAVVAPTGDSYIVVVPRVGVGREVFDALVVTRTSSPFSVTEIARLRALLRFDAERARAHTRQKRTTTKPSRSAWSDAHRGV